MGTNLTLMQQFLTQFQQIETHSPIVQSPLRKSFLNQPSYFILDYLTSLDKNSLQLCLEAAIPYVLGRLILVTGFILIVVALTESFDKAFQTVQTIRRKVLKLIPETEDEKKKRIIKYLLLRINNLYPMNACGYFSIEKSTLTSILSVR